MPYFINAEGKKERLKIGLKLMMHFISLLHKANPYKWFMPTETQKKFLALTLPYQILVAGSRYGKSMWTAIKVACYMLYAPQITGIPILCWCVAPKYQLGEKEFRWVMQAFLALEKSEGKKIIEKLTYSVGSGKFYMRLVNGSELQVISVANKNDENVLGDEVDIIIFSESARQVEFEWLFEAMCVRALANREGYAIFPSTPHGFGFFRKIYLRGKDISPIWHEYVSLGPYTNFQGGGITEERFINSYLTLSEEAFQEQWCGMFIQMSGHVYKDFSFKHHVIRELPAHLKVDKKRTLYCGIDWGFRNPFAMLFAVRDKDGRFYIFDEIYRTGLTNTEKAKLVIPKLKGWSNVYIFADPEDPEAREVFYQFGISSKEAENHVREGIFVVKDYMKVQADGLPRVFYVSQPGVCGDIVYNGCPNLVEEKQKYRWKDTTSEKNELEEPLKLDDHSCDAERYIIASVVEADIMQEMMSIQMSNKISLDDKPRISSDNDYKKKGIDLKDDLKAELAKNKSNIKIY